MAQFKPLNDCVLIDPERVKDYTEQKGFTHVIVPEILRVGPTDPPMWGKVVSKGNGCKDDQVQVGSRVLYAKFGWQKVQVDLDRFLALVREYDLLAVDDKEVTQ